MLIMKSLPVFIFRPLSKAFILLKAEVSDLFNFSDYIFVLILVWMHKVETIMNFKDIIKLHQAHYFTSILNSIF